MGDVCSLEICGKQDFFKVRVINLPCSFYWKVVESRLTAENLVSQCKIHTVKAFILRCGKKHAGNLAILKTDAFSIGICACY